MSVIDTSLGDFNPTHSQSVHSKQIETQVWITLLGVSSNQEVIEYFNRVTKDFAHLIDGLPADIDSFPHFLRFDSQAMRIQSELIKGRILFSLNTGSGNYEFDTPRQLILSYRNLAKGIDYMHSRGFLHRDLKGSNIVRDEHDRLVIIDWDLMIRADKEYQLTTYSDLYTPQVVQDTGIWTYKDELYPFAVCIFISIFGSLPEIRDGVLQKPSSITENFRDTNIEDLILMFNMIFNNPRECHYENCEEIVKKIQSIIE